MPGAGPDLDLVRLSAADADEVATLLVACDRATLPWAPPGWQPPREEDERDWWSERLDKPAIWSRGLRDPDGRLVGFVSMALSTVLPPPPCRRPATSRRCSCIPSCGAAATARGCSTSPRRSSESADGTGGGC